MVETEILVRFAETDKMGIVHHSNYIVYCEAGRVALSKAYGAPYLELEEAGFALAVVEVNLRYAAPALFDQTLVVRTWLETLRSRGMTFGYEIIEKQSGQRVMTGTTKHICITPDGRPARIPQRFMAAMEDAVNDAMV